MFRQTVHLNSKYKTIYNVNNNEPKLIFYYMTRREIYYNWNIYYIYLYTCNML